MIKKEGSDEANLGVEKVRGGILDIEKKVADYYNIRTTDLPTVKMLYPPKPAELRKEVSMQIIKDKLIRKLIEYKHWNCTEKGWQKEKNVSK